MTHEYKPETKALHAGQIPDPTTLSRGVPIYRTSSYVFKDTTHAANLFGLKELGNIYTRLGNPTTDVLEQRLAALEGGAASVALASGTSAIFYSVINLAKVGDEIVSANDLYGGTYTQFGSILPNLGIHTKFVDPTDPDNYKKAINDKTKAIYSEAIGNPALNVPDYEALAEIAQGLAEHLALRSRLPDQPISAALFGIIAPPQGLHLCAKRAGDKAEEFFFATKSRRKI